MKVIIDTCILLDALRNRVPHSKNAQDVVLAVAQDKFKGYLTAASLTDIHDFVIQITNNEERAREILVKLLEIFDLLDTTREDFRRAVFSEYDDFRDAIMMETAMRVEADYIITRNIQEFRGSPIQTYTPAQFLERLEKNAL